MINTRIAYTQEDGTVAIVIPTPEFISNGGDFDALVSSSVPKDASREVVDIDDIPTDRYFRNAWRLNNGIEIDIDKARAIHLNNLREIRNKKLESFDVPFQRALESKDVPKQDEIAAQKQALRDMPKSVDLSVLSAPESLKAFMPDILK